MTKIKAKHAIISPTCRENHGKNGALSQAYWHIQQEYARLVDLEANKDANFHLVLQVERPESK